MPLAALYVWHITHTIMVLYTAEKRPAWQMLLCEFSKGAAFLLHVPGAAGHRLFLASITQQATAIGAACRDLSRVRACYKPETQLVAATPSTWWACRDGPLSL
jgi:hypothetical protein